MKRFIAVLVLAIVATLAVPTAANAATCGSYGLTQTVNRGVPGASVTVTTCFNEPTGTAVTTSFTGPGVSDSDLYAVTPVVSKTSTLGPNGSVSFKVTLPASATNGTVYTVSATTASGGTYSGRIIAVVASSSALPSTGVAIAPYLWLAGALLIAGALLVVILRVARRRRTPVA